MSSGSSYAPSAGRPESGPGQRAGQQMVTANMVQSLDQTRPWVRFLSILMFIGVGFLLLGALFVLVGGAAMSRGMPTALFSIVYVLMAVLYTPPALFLWQYASAIKSMDQRQSSGMEQALGAQRSFWRYVGILAVVLLVIYAIVLAVVVAVAVRSRI